MVEKTRIWYEYMEVGEGAHGQVQVGEAAAGLSGGRRRQQRVMEVIDGSST
jgi:hypothetical protein